LMLPTRHLDVVLGCAMCHALLALSFAARSGRVVAVLVVADGVPVVADGVPVVADGTPVVADGVSVVADGDVSVVVFRSFKLLSYSLSIPFLYVL